MRKKKGFTLLEVMVALSIFALLSLMISAMLIQSQKILAKTDNSANIQNTVRTALLKIQSEAKKYDEVIVEENKYGDFYEDEWKIIGVDTQARELNSSASSRSARELLRFTNSTDDIAKVYVEVNKNNKHQLLELDIEVIDESTSTITNTNVLIDNIIGEGVESISVTDKDDKLIILDCSSMITEEGVNKTNYIASFTKKTIKTIDLPDTGSGSGDKETDGTGSAPETGGQGNSSEEEDDDDESDNGNNTGNNTEFPDATDWDSNKVYLGGEIVYYNGIFYKAAWYNSGSNPEFGNVWIIMNEEPTEWKSTKTYLQNQEVIYNGIIYKAYYENTNYNPEFGNAWIIMSEEPTEWKSTKTYLQNQEVIYNGIIYKASYENSNNNPESSNAWIKIS